MASKSKAKGHGFEREVVKLLDDAGFEAQRAWGSNGEAMNEHAEVDIKAQHKHPITGYGNPDVFKFQCKRKKKIADYMIPSEHVDGVIVREDYGEPLIVIRLKDYLELI